ncbi:thermonuclease family protein [Thiobacillus denitrificans]|uniref:thermonuclease family protein n=1 Tax=Thiobacillus denitrificans TaxID=36861 RepID=UPI0003A6A4BC|nr:thermonuclease family protein [Thiobacillus denitrificans]
MKIGLAIFSLLAVVSLTQAETLVGEVVGLADGDTVTVLDAQRVQHKIRLAGIDAPEKGMPWGQKSKEALSDRVYRRTVTVEWQKHDRYGRLVGKIMVDGRDANLAQVADGMAWHYKDYQNEQTLEDRLRYAQAELDARNARRGLWAEPEPVAPWTWRKMKREARMGQP